MKCRYDLKAECPHAYNAYSLCGTPMGITVDDEDCIKCCLAVLAKKVLKLEASNAVS